MKACTPDQQGHIERDDVRVAYYVYGKGNAPTILLLPSWSIVHAELWKMQVPVLARHHRVITIDPRGNGGSDRPTDPAGYDMVRFVDDAVGVLDTTGTQRAIIVGMSLGAPRAVLLAARHPERVDGAVLIGPAVPYSPRGASRDPLFDAELDNPEGWALYNKHVWRERYRDFLDFFWSQVFTEPHSTKQIEDCTGWALESDGVMLATAEGADPGLRTREELLAVLAGVRCPTLVIHGTDDAIRPVGDGIGIADALNADLLLIQGGGHAAQSRHPVVVNRAILDFVDRVTPPADRAARQTTWTRALNRPKKVLYLSSPIGLGHARRDLAIADELRKLHEDVHIDWLAQHPVTRVLADAGESVHPASAYLASESAHIEDEAGEHDLHAFQAVRRMDQILITNFTVLQDAVDGGDYDLVVGDEAWDLDYYWHENPELKRTAFVWMTDFVGWLPMSDGGEREAALTADYNAEMLEQIARFKRVRDRSIFVGDPADIVPDTFGPGLPSIRDWTEQHFDFCGYITGFDSATLQPARESDDPLAIVTVGGSGVGNALLHKVIEALPIARKEIPELRMLAVSGPRIDPESLPQSDGLEVRGYVSGLHRYLAGADVAVVQGGLTTTMELVATRRPFLYFPLANHFEQQRHVRHRLDRYRAGRCMSYADSDPDEIAAALVEQIQAPVDYLPVATDGASRAAKLIADLI